jgi:hypothetical protein
MRILEAITRFRTGKLCASSRSLPVLFLALAASLLLSPPYRALAAESNSGREIGKVVEDLAAPRAEDRLKALDTISSFGEKAVPFLAKALRSPVSIRRTYAIVALGLTRSKDAAPVLIDFFLDGGQTQRDRFLAVGALGRTKAGEAVPVLLGALGDENLSIRQAATSVLRDLSGPCLVPKLLPNLASDSSPLRESSLDLLRSIAIDYGLPLSRPAAKAEKKTESGRERWTRWWRKYREKALARLGPPQLAWHRIETRDCRIDTTLPPEQVKPLVPWLRDLKKAYERWFRVGTARRWQARLRIFAHRRNFRQWGRKNVFGFHRYREHIYSYLYREIIAYSLGNPELFRRKIAHEFFHDFAEHYCGPVSPWLNEGLAEYFEGGHVVRGRFRKIEANREWYPHLRPLLASGSPFDLKGLMATSADDFYGDGSERRYALSWALIYTLVHSGHGRRKPLLIKAFQKLRKGGGTEAVAALFPEEKHPELERAVRLQLESLFD